MYGDIGQWLRINFSKYGFIYLHMLAYENRRFRYKETWPWIFISVTNAGKYILENSVFWNLAQHKQANIFNSVKLWSDGWRRKQIISEILTSDEPGSFIEWLSTYRLLFKRVGHYRLLLYYIQWDNLLKDKRL